MRGSLPSWPAGNDIGRGFLFHYIECQHGAPVHSEVFRGFVGIKLCDVYTCIMKNEGSLKAYLVVKIFIVVSYFFLSSGVALSTCESTHNATAFLYFFSDKRLSLSAHSTMLSAACRPFGRLTSGPVICAA